jgi:hypothetical protein
MSCPICKKEVNSSDPFLPFCSDRCRLLDLANWVSGKYVVSTPLQPDDGELDAEPAKDEQTN